MSLKPTREANLQTVCSPFAPLLQHSYLEYIPENERHDMISAYYKRLTSPDEQQRLEAARRWSTWENATSKLYLDHKHMAKGDDDQWALQFARIESHFFSHGGWMEDGHLLKPESVARIAHIPTIVVQGRYDGVCPAVTAWDLREAWLKAPGGDKTLEVSEVSTSSICVVRADTSLHHPTSVLHGSRRRSLGKGARHRRQALVCNRQV